MLGTKPINTICRECLIYFNLSTLVCKSRILTLGFDARTIFVHQTRKSDQETEQKPLNGEGKISVGGPGATHSAERYDDGTLTARKLCLRCYCGYPHNESCLFT
jgi:hypothetical protein